MKKVVGILIAIFGLTFIQPTHAAELGSIAIIDTAIDSTRPELKNNLVYEVCIVTGGTCANGKTSAEGVGAATLPVSQAYTNGFEHGTIMSLIAKQVDPSVKIVFIRIAGMDNKGKMVSYKENAITNALSWVVANKTKYNIVSVSTSMGSTGYNSGLNYCPIKATHAELISNIDKLINVGVPTMFAAGNERDLNRINFPACIPQAVAVSGTNAYSADDGYIVSPLVNSNKDVDFYALGAYSNAVRSQVFGDTSSATVALSAYWAKNYKGSYQTTYNYLKSITQPITKGRVLTNLFVDITK